MSAKTLEEALAMSVPDHRNSLSRLLTGTATAGHSGPQTPREKISLLIDTDAGTDDASCIMAAFADPLVEVAAITVVDGNTDLAQGIKNIKTIVSVGGRRDVPIYAGADGPLVRGMSTKELWPGNGEDGLGNVTVHPPEELALEGTDDIVVPEGVHAAAKLVELVNRDPGKHDVLAIGPLTNIAIAISLDPTFLTKIKGLYVMGGTLYAKGNANRASEFNIHCDPEAAHVVFHASTVFTKNVATRYATERGITTLASEQPSTVKKPLVLPPNFAPKIALVTWELAVEHGFPWSFFDYLTITPPVNKMGRFLGTFHKCAESLSRAQYEFLSAGPRPMSPVQPVLVSKATTDKVDSATEQEVAAGSTTTDSDIAQPTPRRPTEKTTNGSRKPSPSKKTQQDEYLCGMQSFLMPDFYAYAALVDPNSMVSYKDWDVQVELHGQFTRGMTHFDWFGSPTSIPNCRVILEMDREIVKKIYEKTFKY